jgi:hypothetical protein
MRTTHKIAAASLLLFNNRNSTPTVSVSPSANASQTIGVDPGYVAGTWSSGTPVFDRWESSADGSVWATAAAMPDADSPPTDAEFGKVLRVIEVNGSTEAASAATGAVDYALVLHDTFTSGSVAAGTRNAEVGSWTIVDSTPVLSLASGKLQAATGGVDATNPRLTSSTFTRAQGVVCVVKAKSSATAREILEIVGGVTRNGGMEQQQGFFFDGASSITTVPQPIWSRTNDDFAFVFKATGVDMYLKSGGTGSWRLLWRGLTGNSATLSLLLYKVGTTATFSLSEVIVRAGMGGVWQTTDGMLSVNVASPVSGASQTATADGQTDFAFTLPASPSAGDKVGLKFRYRDASNYWHAFCERNAGNTAWDFKCQSVAAGTPTDRITPVTGVGAVRRIRVAHNGSLINCYTMDASDVPTPRGGNINISHENSETAILAEYAAGTTASALQSQPLTSATYADLDNVPLA